MLAITTADIRSPMKSAELPPVLAAYISDIGRAPTPRPPAMIGAAMNRMPSMKPKPVASPRSPIMEKVAMRQPTRGTMNLGPAFSRQGPGHAQDTAGDDGHHEEIEEPVALHEVLHHGDEVLGHHAGEDQDGGDEGAQDGRQPEVPEHRNGVADPDKESTQDDRRGEAGEHRIGEVAGQCRESRTARKLR